MATHVLPLHRCTSELSHEVGGKATGLGALTKQGLSVPPGFAVTVSAYREAIAAAGVAPRIAESLATTGTDRDRSAATMTLFDQVTLPESLAAQVVDAYTQMGGGPVAVRSSAIAEDTAEASFAGQQDTYLWIEGAPALLEAVVRCWASLYTPRAIAYRRRFNVASVDVAMAVVVQRMVPAVAAGVTMTLEPVTGDRGQIYIASALGLGEGVVNGDVETDSTWVDKARMCVRKRKIARQTRAHRYENGAVRIVDLAPARVMYPASMTTRCSRSHASPYKSSRTPGTPWMLSGPWTPTARFTCCRPGRRPSGTTDRAELRGLRAKCPAPLHR
ncbi:pyruvate phosphate dikinase, PEP/pyruvate binding domain protein [Mycobacterium intracellulare 1956]|uniref:Phosphoenolpyruvate synthase n=1 Tax=Mycobacterium intracellulare 1956 TaxID=1299331 RepID=X8CT59_MYCIT|nr:pyruvate phosphate dikinase, PEP/pyruvate binding domain protein [Mycobacterium intracellulare 1956]